MRVRGAMPALLTSRSIRPKRSSAACTRRARVRRGADVGLHHKRVAAGLSDQVSGLIGRSRIAAIVDNHRPPCLCQRQRNPAPNPGGPRR